MNRFKWWTCCIVVVFVSCGSTGEPGTTGGGTGSTGGGTGSTGGGTGSTGGGTGSTGGGTASTGGGTGSTGGGTGSTGGGTGSTGGTGGGTGSTGGGTAGTGGGNSCVSVRWYRDADGDGYGTADTFQDACARPNGYVMQGSDCDDGAEGVHPGATEVCDAVDNDCDGTINGTAVQQSACSEAVGQYKGAYTLYTAEKLGTTVLNEMTCTGTDTLTITLAAGGPAVSGTLTCTYSKSITLFDKTQSGKITGTLGIDGTLKLTVVHEFASGLSRTFTTQGTLTGTTFTATGTGSWLPNPRSAVPWVVEINMGGTKP